MIKTSVYHSDTGHAAIDAVIYGQRPAMSHYAHSQSDILLYRISSYGNPGSLTSVEYRPSQPDLIFLSRGAGVPAFGEVGGDRFKRPANRALAVSFIPHGHGMKGTFGTTANSANLMFPPGMLRRLVADQEGGEFRPLLYSSDPRLIQLVRLLDGEIRAPSLASHLFIDGVSRCLAGLLTGVNVDQRFAEADRIVISPVKLRNVKAYIEENLDQNINLSTLAELAGLSVFHFSRVFKRATGMTPYQYVKERRLALSQDLLVKGSMSISELALACGFANQSHFTTAFSRAMGVSPKRFRALAMH